MVLSLPRPPARFPAQFVMASSAEVLQKAASLSSGGAPDAKRLRVGAPTASQSKDTQLGGFV